MTVKIHKKGTLFLRTHVGKATDNDGNSYEMALNVNNSVPIIRSEKTGKWATISWGDIIELAVQAGVDKKGKP